MKRFCVIAGVVIALLVTATYSFAKNAADHVALAPNGKGDVVVWPVNMQLAGFQTKLELINTSPNYSVVVKVIIRSGVYSQELVDFFVYLSPTDVWIGYLEYGPNGPRIYSSDGSCLNLNGGWASETDPFEIDLNHADALCSGDTDQYTYTTAIMTWSKYEGPIGEVDLPIDKDDIKKDFDQDVEDKITPASIDVLAAHEEISVPGTGWWAAMQATIFQNNRIDAFLQLSRESFLGESSNNSLCEFEAVLARDNVVVPYTNLNRQDESNLTAPFFSWITKSTKLTNCVWDGFRSPFFNANAVKDEDDYENCIAYGRNYYDLEENTPEGDIPIVSPIPKSKERYMCEEVEWFDLMVDVAGMYDEGWVNYVFGDSTTCDADDGLTEVQFTGAPVVTSVMGLKATGITLMPTAHSLGTVTLDGQIVEPNGLYQYVPGLPAQP